MPQKNSTPIKPLKDSSMTHEESEDTSFRASQLEGLLKGFLKKVDLENLKIDLKKSMEGSVKTLDLANLQTQMDERMGHMEDNIERNVNLWQHQDENIPKEDYVGQGAHDVNNSAHVEQISINKHGLRGFYSNIGSSQWWSTWGIQLPKSDMRKFDDKDPMTWIFQMEQFFEIHQVPNL